MTQRPSLAIFSGYYPSHGGGIEIVTGRLAEGLARDGYRIFWCALDDGSETNSEPVERRPLPGTDFAYRATGTPMPLPSPKALRCIWATIDAADVVLIAEANFMSNAIAFAMAKLKGRPVLLTQHLGLPSTASCIARSLTWLSERCIARCMLRAADQVVYVSNAVRDYFHDVRTRSEPLIVGHGVDTSVFRAPSSSRQRDAERHELGFAAKTRLACFAGRCTRSKGVEIVAEMARRQPNWTFVIAGSGPIDPADWKLPNVRTLGHLEPDRLASLYRASDVLVLPSPSESFSLVVREALACGTSVLCGDSILLTDRNLEKFVCGVPVDLENIEETGRIFAEALPTVPQATNGGAAYVTQHCSWDGIVARYAETLAALFGSRSATKQMVPA